ncbi:ScyD/ScyE family protein [Robiginitalea sp. SC105]|uniref:ScyD/ScyE family protein n=1 Tax=Robiginitalea sp. SC105 TaxID=2762332 RepID=UPI00163B515A|nr:ScyD/ScyE family protein [Robiginitalea sp. SC105]MBC2838612.1 ScyD/ScyE family protein [Robiginitalea sp. SC105]
MNKHAGLLYPATNSRAKITLWALGLLLTTLLLGCEKDTALTAPGPEEMYSLKSKNIQEPGTPELFASGLQGTAGSTVGPGGALYVTENNVSDGGDPYSRISRIDPKTGNVTTYASGLPPTIIGIGGAWDIAFLGGTAYVLVTIVDDPLFPTGLVNGIYRVDGPESFTVIADIGQFNLDNQPTGFDIILQTGVLYSIQAYRGGFLVTDGHLNRMLHVTLDGEISILKSFDNIVPTGLDVSGNTIYMAHAGMAPHLPEDGRILAFGPDGASVSTVATGAPLLVDVEMGLGRTLFGLAQGIWEGDPETDDGTPATADSGSLMRANADGTFSTVVTPINLPTSLEIIDNTAYIVNLAGEVWKVENISGPPFGS